VREQRRIRGPVLAAHVTVSREEVGARLASPAHLDSDVDAAHHPALGPVVEAHKLVGPHRQQGAPVDALRENVGRMLLSCTQGGRAGGRSGRRQSRYPSFGEAKGALKHPSAYQDSFGPS